MRVEGDDKYSKMLVEADSKLECIDRGRGDCSTKIEYRHALSGTGVSFPRCDNHWEVRLHEQEKINDRYPDSPIAPSDFDPTYAGERWDDED